MPLLTSPDTSRATPKSGFRPVLLFLLAIGLLMMMSLAIAPTLALPLVAFVAMAAVTRLLGLRLYDDLTQAVDHHV
ncbi:MAG: hypothetical protein RIE06_12690 [Roseibium album]|uniref:Uncharacterized protein n=1 Tax=Roseibium album TaxID=311410 RepID=A0A0M7ARK6_9HYPH|nr:hypothetical protein [Roseibium album]MBG6146434.1 hypothetical protein [Labrenzia sp. EL_142]MBG6156568.1 hypothetical protein [Labrenzia sp. EL_162]MBG6164900.1 hypothetical protein [Labrenzia sp. EL_195]MBG6173409.1 hypothetical protein [Labrenzia sp. EL_132]MBG6195492.1 hypothetical protein [Labrenzia sp. EL_159]MBG6208322.1 hypothetical protein [Labrenzia sp. EL_126]MBG6227821.1 hypothetical protein [Labrenzia sp. EL_208]MCR9059489.1 hypothetical protein [Paracoccaceae bacterium]